MAKATTEPIVISYAKGREFKAGIMDLLGAPVDAIVNPANSGLSHGGGLAAVISDEAGSELDTQCKKIVNKIGKIPVTLGVPTDAFNLPFKGIIHAVGPRMGDGDELEKLIKTITNSLLIAEKKGWKSIAFPAMGTGIFGIPKALCAEAFQKAIPLYWDNHPDSVIHLIWLCLTLNDLNEFINCFKTA
jgi:O-acetyl-ADP-ribose deacetylase (regulator of RNase III)